MTSTTLDSQLVAEVELARGGDVGAFSRLVERTTAMVCSIAFVIVRDVAASEDIAQEVYLAAWRGLRKLKNPASFLPWLRQMTRNQANSWLRALYARSGPDHAGDEILASVAAPGPSAQAQIEQREDLELVSQALDDLPAEAREVLVLYYREGRSTAQVASLLGLSEAAARQRLSRARKQIRDDVAARIQRSLERTAPGLTLVGSVMAAVATSTGPASAVALSAVGARGVAGAGAKMVGVWALAAALPGILAGIGGVVLGLRREFAQAIDAQEIAELRAFRRVGVATVVAAGFGLVWSSMAQLWWPPVVVYLAFMGALAALYFGWLPRIQRRRLAHELATDPEAPAKHRRRRLVCILGYTLGALSGGVGLLVGLGSSGL